MRSRQASLSERLPPYEIHCHVVAHFPSPIMQSPLIHSRTHALTRSLTQALSAFFCFAPLAHFFLLVVLRLSVQVNPHDYRAWHGLGQTYEFMQMYSYALHYYQKAYLLRPFDERMSQSLGTCYEQLKQPSSAVQCFTRALKLADDRETRLRVRFALIVLQSAATLRSHVIATAICDYFLFLALRCDDSCVAK